MQRIRHALANQKGGVGKTATTLGLASAISHRGGRALVVDMDPQANATEGLGVYTADGKMLKKGRMFIENGRDKNSLRIDEFLKGTYILFMETSDQTFSKKIIIE